MGGQEEKGKRGEQITVIEYRGVEGIEDGKHRLEAVRGNNITVTNTTVEKALHGQRFPVLH